MSDQGKSKDDSVDLDSIPMADDCAETSADEDKQSQESQSDKNKRLPFGQLPTGVEDRSLSPVRISDSEASNHEQPQTSFLLDSDLTPEEQEEKARLIAQVLELQNTLDDLSSRVDNVKEENLRLRSENQVLGQYIENLMAASSVFQPTNEQPKSFRRK